NAGRPGGLHNGRGAGSSGAMAGCDHRRKPRGRCGPSGAGKRAVADDWWHHLHLIGRSSSHPSIWIAVIITIATAEKKAASKKPMQLTPVTAEPFASGP